MFASSTWVASPNRTCFVRINQIKYKDIPLHDVRFSDMSLLQASFRMCGLNYSRGTLSVTFKPEVRAEDLNTPLTGSATVGRIILNNVAKALLRDGRPRMEAMQQLYVGDSR